MLGPLDDALSEIGAGRLGGSQEERVRLARRNGDRLLTLVNMLLDFNRLQAGRVEPQLEAIDLASETEELASMFRSAVEAGGLELVVDTPSLEQPVAVDRRMWEQIVTNLISNAFKHTFEGKIEVSLRAVDDSVELTVRDSGEGIPELELPLVFDRFHRVKGARARSGEGSGIGLALVRELVEVQGGSIELASELGEGTTARVVLPAKRGHLPPSPTSGATERLLGRCSVEYGADPGGRGRVVARRRHRGRRRRRGARRMMSPMPGAAFSSSTTTRTCAPTSSGCSKAASRCAPSRAGRRHSRASRRNGPISF